MNVEAAITNGGSELKRIERALRKVGMDLHADLSLLASAKLVASRIQRLKDLLSKHGHLVTIEELPQIFERQARRVYVVFGKTCIEVEGAIFVEPEMLNGCEVVAIDRRRKTEIAELCEVISGSVDLPLIRERAKRKAESAGDLKPLVNPDEETLDEIFRRMPRRLNSWR